MVRNSRFPPVFSGWMNCTTADYKVTLKGYVEVFNACRKDSITGKLKSIRGKAFMATNSKNSKLEV